MKQPILSILCIAVFASGLLPWASTYAQVPEVIHYQGRVSVDGADFTGVGHFKFAVVDQHGATLWNRFDQSRESDEPHTSISLQVHRGVFSVMLGDPSIPGMFAFPSETFDNPPVFLRVWFSEHDGDFVQLTPDQPITAVPYALRVGKRAINRIHVDEGIGLWDRNSGGSLSTTENVGIGLGTPMAPLQVLGSVISGHHTNIASGRNSFVSGGQQLFSFELFQEIGHNTASGIQSFAGGGFANTASGVNSFVAGGNRNTASGPQAFVGGGMANSAEGWRSFAAGRRARAAHNGTFVWADNADTEFASTAGNQFLIRARGGVGINTNNPGGFDLSVDGSAAKPGGGSWSTFSDVHLKHSIEPIEPGMLDRLLSLTGYTFEYRDDAVELRLGRPGEQIGLLAQEVAEVFPDWVDRDSEGYLYVTERGVTAIVVEALRELRAEKDRTVREHRRIIDSQADEIAGLRAQVDELVQTADQYEELEQRLSQIEASLGNEPLATQ